MSLTEKQVESLTIELTREPFTDWVTLTLPDGQSFDMDWEEIKMWMKLRNADMDIVDKALDDVYNFYSSTVIIKNPRIVKVKLGKDDPKI